MSLTVLTWNLKHGRAVPSAGRNLYDEFADKLGSWGWDAALLQEVPPWWPAALGARLGCEQRFVLTSRNFLLPVRRAIAVRWPDLIKSSGGGCNAILARRGVVAEHRARRLCLLPERRWVHGVRLTIQSRPVWVCNLHTNSNALEGRRAAVAAAGWASGAAAGPAHAETPALLGGDFNVRGLMLEGWRPAGGHGVDQFYVRGLEPVGPAQVLDRGHLSDHAPVMVTVRSLVAGP